MQYYSTKSFGKVLFPWVQKKWIQNEFMNWFQIIWGSENIRTKQKPYVTEITDNTDITQKNEINNIIKMYLKTLVYKWTWGYVYSQWHKNENHSILDIPMNWFSNKSILKQNWKPLFHSWQSWNTVSRLFKHSNSLSAHFTTCS